MLVCADGPRGKDVAMKRPSPHYKAILAVLTKSPQTANDIAEKAKVKPRTTRQHLAMLVAEGRVLCDREFPSFLYRAK